MDEKQGLERGAIENFADHFSRQESRGSLVFRQLLQPPFPDAHCDLEGKTLYVEVAHIYGTEADARYLLGRKGKAEPTKKERLNSSLIPLNKRYLEPLNRVLRQKAEKTYEGNPIWLLIRNGLPIWTREEFNERLDEIIVPEKHPFEEIWLLCAPTGTFGAIRLYGSA